MVTRIDYVPGQSEITVSVRWTEPSYEGQVVQDQGCKTWQYTCTK